MSEEESACRGASCLISQQSSNRFWGQNEHSHFPQASNKMASINSLLTLTLDLPPSCIEFWPRNSQYAVVGTYNLEKEDGQGSGLSDPAQHEGQKGKSQSRNGSLILVRVVGDSV